jgi:hypothetical protein
VPDPDAHEVNLTRGTPETVLAPLDLEVAEALAGAAARPPDERGAALRRVAARWPACLDAWAALAEEADDPVDRYAFARVGYHRGLDALRARGWRGAGHVRWSAAPNRGFLRSLEALRRAAADIGEAPEAERCALFLRQLDPGWPPEGLPGA